MFVSARTAHPEAVAAFLNSFAEEGAAVSFMKETQNISVIKAALAVNGWLPLPPPTAANKNIPAR